MKRNLLLLLFLISSSSLVAVIFGDLINTKIFGPSGFEGFFVPREIVNFINSFPFVYCFVSPLLFLSWGKGRKWAWTIGSVLPLIVLEIYIGAFASLWSLFLIFFALGVVIPLITNYLIKNWGSRSLSN